MVRNREAQMVRQPRKDLVRLSLDTALELDRLRRGKDAAQSVIDAFEQSLKAPPREAALAPGRLYLNDSPRAEDAYYRAARSLPGARQSLDALKRRLIKILADIRPALDDPRLVKDERIRTQVSQLETFCLRLHDALSTERPIPRRFGSRKERLNETNVG